MWDALERVGLKEVVERLPKGLDAPVAEFGESLSVGQRQLVCLARVLLRSTRTSILALDEASASLDHVSDAALQKVIKESFAHATVLIVAHRLNTIITADRILVLDSGSVVEYAHPHELLTAEKKSAFAALVDEMGPSAAAGLRAEAAKAYASRKTA
jgi:ABC-type multidrug transport system fused ATPase/permease subunit